MATKARRGTRQRLASLHATEQGLWREWESALKRYQEQGRRLERSRGRWADRVNRSMRGVDPAAWWRTNSRIERGEVWVPSAADARRVQRVVYITRPAVLALVSRRDAELRVLGEALVEVDAELRAVSQSLVAVAGRDRVLDVLQVPSPALAHLLGGVPIPQSTAALLHVPA